MTDLIVLSVHQFFAESCFNLLILVFKTGQHDADDP